MNLVGRFQDGDFILSVDLGFYLLPDFSFVLEKNSDNKHRERSVQNKTTQSSGGAFQKPDLDKNWNTNCSESSSTALILFFVSCWLHYQLSYFIFSASCSVFSRMAWDNCDTGFSIRLSRITCKSLFRDTGRQRWNKCKGLRHWQHRRLHFDVPAHQN